MNTKLIETAIAQRGLGWLGAMELIDTLHSVRSVNQCVSEVIARMQYEVGQHILSGSEGCDESALTQACNQCIEAAIEVLIRSQSDPMAPAAT